MTIPVHIAAQLSALAAQLREVPRAELEELWTERAGIREYDGRQSRVEAEDGALDDVRSMYTAQVQA